MFCVPVCYPKNIKIKIYRTVTLRVVLYGCETWSLTLTDERWLRVFENRVLRRIFGPNRVLRRIFGPKTDEITEVVENHYDDHANQNKNSPNYNKEQRGGWGGFA